MSKAIQVYDETEEKLVDIPEDEVESVRNTRLTYLLFNGMSSNQNPPQFQPVNLSLDSCSLE